MSTRSPEAQRRASEKARAGRVERRLLLPPDVAAKAERLAGPGRQRFSDWVNELIREAWENGATKEPEHQP